MHYRRHGDILVLIGRPEDVYHWSTRWLQTERDLNPKDTDHVAALEAHLKRMTELERDVKQRLGLLLSDLAKHEVEWYVLEARLWLERAKSH